MDLVEQMALEMLGLTWFEFFWIERLLGLPHNKRCCMFEIVGVGRWGGSEQILQSYKKNVTEAVLRRQVVIARFLLIKDSKPLR